MFINPIIVNLGTGYETLGISKAGTIQSQLDVEPTMTLHNLLFLGRKLILNRLVETFDWLSCRKKRVFVGPVLCRVKAKKANKDMKQRKLSSFLTSLHLLTYNDPIIWLCIKRVFLIFLVLVLLLVLFLVMHLSGKTCVCYG